MIQQKVLGIGSALVDILTQIEDDTILEQLGLPKGSMQHVDANRSLSIGQALEKEYNSVKAAGGSAANTASGLAKLGIEAGFLSKVGRDDIGDFFEKEMIKTNVKPLLLKTDTPSGRVQAIVSKDGERTFATYLGASLELCPDDIQPELFEGWDIFYVEGYLVANKPMLEKAIATAKAKGMKIALDMASYNIVEENREYMIRMIQDGIDIIFANEEEAKALTGVEGEEALHQIAKLCDIAIVKLGAKGSLVQQGDRVIVIDPIPAKVVDTTGAGDMWAAGFLAGYVKGEDLKRCATMGAIVAANIIEVIGAKMDDERWNKIYHSLGNN